MNPGRTETYAKRFEKVFEHVDRHLDDALDVETLSRVAHFSRFHFHRQFSEFVGIGVARYVQLMRLRRASYRLVFHPAAPITELALEAGFENPESFSRAFRKAFGQSPSAFRKQPAWQPWAERYRFPPRTRTQQMDVNIVEFEATRVAALDHIGPPALVNASVERFIAWRKASGLSPIATSRSFGIAYDNPETTAPEQFRFCICGAVAADVPANPQGVVTRWIPGGRCAVVRHLGSHAHVGSSIYPLFRDWLPASGEELRDFPLFFHYLNLMPDTPEHELVTDIYLPLK